MFGDLLPVSGDLAADCAAATVEFLAGRYAGTYPRRSPDPSPALADQMCELVDTLGGITGKTVLDPACGLGTALTAARERGASRCLGQDIEPNFATVTATRLLLAAASSRVACGSSLDEDAFAELRADAVLCRPPLGTRTWNAENLANDPRWEHGLPPRGEPELAWLAHCLSHTAVGGHVVMAMPPAVASRRAGRRIRGNLLRSGALRAVLRVATGTGSSGTTDLWVLRRPPPGEEPPARLLVCDGTSEVSRPVRSWRTFTADENAELPARSSAPRLLDLLDEEIDLSPGRHLPATSAPDGQTYPAARTNLAELARRLAAMAPDLAIPDVETPFGTATLGDLARAGDLVIHQAPMRMTVDEGEQSVLTAKDVRAGRGPSGRTGPAPDAVRIEPGDVLTPATPHHLAVRVAADGTEADAVLGPHLMLLRVVPDRLDPYVRAGFLRAAAAGGTLTSSTQSLRIDPRRAPVPLLPVEQQRRYGQAFRELLDVEDAARELTATAETLVRSGFGGLAAGILTPEGGAS